MRNVTINMSLNPDSIQKAINKVRAEKAQIESKSKELIRRLAEIGVEGARVRFESAVYDGINDVQVESNVISEHSVAIHAFGTTLLFIEFGTGIVYPDDHPLAGEMEMIRGSYGQGKGSQRTWAYYGEPGTNGVVLKEGTPNGDLIKTHGNPANQAMYLTGKELEQRVRDIAQEIFV